MMATKDRLNVLFARLDKTDSKNSDTHTCVEECLKTGWWALSLVMELAPFQSKCAHGPTNPLRFFFLQRLEEILTKCFTAAYMFGNADQQMVGLRGLVTDFQSNGGVNLQTGEPGAGLYHSLCMYFDAHFWPNDREAFVYEKFGDLVCELGNLVRHQHPKCKMAFSEVVRRMLGHQFGRKDITSAPKTLMVAKLNSLSAQLGVVEMNAHPKSEELAEVG
jgi:hypothetical protein